MWTQPARVGQELEENELHDCAVFRRVHWAGSCSLCLLHAYRGNYCQYCRNAGEAEVTQRFDIWQPHCGDCSYSSTQHVECRIPPVLCAQQVVEVVALQGFSTSKQATLPMIVSVPCNSASQSQLPCPGTNTGQWHCISATHHHDEEQWTDAKQLGVHDSADQHFASMSVCLLSNLLIANVPHADLFALADRLYALANGLAYCSRIWHQHISQSYTFSLLVLLVSMFE